MKGKCMSLMPMMMVPMGSLAQPSPMLAWMQRPAGTPCGPLGLVQLLPLALPRQAPLAPESHLKSVCEIFKNLSIYFPFHFTTLTPAVKIHVWKGFFSKTSGLENLTMCAQLTEMRKVRPRGNESRWFFLMNTIAMIRTRWWEVNVKNILNSQWSQRQR